MQACLAGIVQAKLYRLTAQKRICHPRTTFEMVAIWRQKWRKAHSQQMACLLRAEGALLAVLPEQGTSYWPFAVHILLLISRAKLLLYWLQ